ncbi:MAG: lysophospholipid acyltransferase family protein [Sphaerochaeta sp.]
MVYILWGMLIIAIMVFIAIFTAIIPGYILHLIGLGKVADSLIFWHAALISNIGLWLSGTRVHVSGNLASIRKRIKNGESFCFVSNHTSILDIILMLGKLGAKAGFVTKRELVYVPLINAIIASTHSVFIDRKNLRRSVASIKKATENIRKGHSMVIFPEGTRSKTGEIGFFKHGSFRMATESGAEIVPITVKGLRGQFEERRRFFQTGDCYLHVGNPVKPVSPADREAVSAMITSIENEIKETYAKL